MFETYVLGLIGIGLFMLFLLILFGSPKETIDFFARILNSIISGFFGWLGKVAHDHFKRQKRNGRKRTSTRDGERSSDTFK